MNSADPCPRLERRDRGPAVTTKLRHGIESIEPISQATLRRCILHLLLALPLALSATGHPFDDLAAACLAGCAKLGKAGCCQDLNGKCSWFDAGWVTGGGSGAEAAANCHSSPNGCDGWNWGQMCMCKTCTPQPVTPGHGPTPPPPPPPKLPVNPTGDGKVEVNLFTADSPWVGTDGERIQALAHSGMLFHDDGSMGNRENGDAWVLISNSDADPGQVGTG